MFHFSSLVTGLPSFSAVTHCRQTSWEAWERGFPAFSVFTCAHQNSWEAWLERRLLSAPGLLRLSKDLTMPSSTSISGLASSPRVPVSQPPVFPGGPWLFPASWLVSPGSSLAYRLSLTCTGPLLAAVGHVTCVCVCVCMCVCVCVVCVS